MEDPNEPDDYDEGIEMCQTALAEMDENDPDRAACLGDLAMYLMERYTVTEKIADLEEAIQTSRCTISILSENSDELAEHSGRLSDGLWLQYENSNDNERLDDAIDATRKAFQLATEDPPKSVIYGNSLGERLLHRYASLNRHEDLQEVFDIVQNAVKTRSEKNQFLPDLSARLALALEESYEGSKSLKILDEAIFSSRLSIEELSEDEMNPEGYMRMSKEVFNIEIDETFDRIFQKACQDQQLETLGRLSQLARLLGHRYSESRAVNDLEEIIQANDRIIQRAPATEERLYLLLNDQAIYLRDHFKRTQDMKSLENAIKWSREAVQTSPKSSVYQARSLNTLANALSDRFNQSENIDDINEGLSILRKAIEIPDQDPNELSIWLNGLSAILKARHDRFGHIQDLEEAIQASSEAVKQAPSDSPDISTWLRNLANNKLAHYECTQLTASLDDAINISRQALDSNSHDNEDRAGAFDALGSALTVRFEITGKTEDLNEAIKMLHQAIEVSSEDKSELAGWLNNLSVMLRARYERFGTREDLEEAIQTSRNAIILSKDGHPGLPTWLGGLASHLQCRYERIGNMEDLEESVTLCRQAIDLTPSDHFDIGQWFVNLAIKLEQQYARSGRLDILEEAIRTVRQGIDKTPQTYYYFITFQNDLANLLQYRYGRTKQFEDLEEAVSLIRRAIGLTPENHPDLPKWLANLSNKLHDQFKQSHEMKYLEDAIISSRRAVELTPNDHLDLGAYLINLGHRLQSRYRQTRQQNDIEEALQFSFKAIEITPQDHPSMAECLIYTGKGLSLYPTRKTEAFDLFYRGWNCVNASPLVRIKAAVSLLNLLGDDLNQLQVAYMVSAQAIALLPHVHNRFLSFQDRQYIVGLFSGLATKACSLAFKTENSHAEALALLEQGRTIIISLLLDDRSDTSELKSASPELCAQYENLRVELARLSESKSLKGPEQLTTQARQNTIEQLEQCITEIRELPGLSSFQKGLTEEQMINVARENGTIIIVNITNIGSHAISIRSTEISSISLPAADSVQTQRWIELNLTTSSSRDRGKMNKAYRQFLIWLWRSCVKPIADHLAYPVQQDPEKLPRVWWIGSGLASSFPFHAAGDASPGSTENAWSRVLSSYASSIKALKHSRERSAAVTSAQKKPIKALVVSMPETPGAFELPKAEIESSTVSQILGSSMNCEALHKPNAATVLDHMFQCKIAHFACHGVSNVTDPFQSGLLLQSGDSSNPTQDILSVRSLCNSDSTLGGMAFLSACSTAESRVKKLDDEMLHVVSGFQVAGFRHVIGCLWPVDDNVCVEVASSFYSELCQGDSLESEDRSIALALHKAVLKISSSREYCRRPLHWASYVHFGA
ncbi:hypothetical protein N7478_011246 [Penicillium angulare]|uniref:uncharacterized protein n=1 Tax=Penicillium angulare TaxID=116970 RepID=UPI0025417FCF|nr:uncharacterized protein N7478_011246 [Penicillium angulare]KAJ5263641.1 hypothetical protein N7478_011246 [Penicillium angulare]